jgi:hypothetical protein
MHVISETEYLLYEGALTYRPDAILYRWKVEKSGLDSRQGKETCQFSVACGPGLESAQPRIQCVPGLFHRG